MGGPIGPVPPVLGAGDELPYEGRNPAAPMGPPYDDPAASRWLYVEEETDPQRLGQLKEKFGAASAGWTRRPDRRRRTAFFYNEQMWTLPWHYTEFVMPNQPDDGDDPARCDADKYLVTSAFTQPVRAMAAMADAGRGCAADRPAARRTWWRTSRRPAASRWASRGGRGSGSIRMKTASCSWTSDGVRLYGGVPEREEYRVRSAAAGPGAVGGRPERARPRRRRLPGRDPAVHGPVGAVQPAAPARAAGRTR